MKKDIAVEAVVVGMLINDERFPHVMKVGHIGTGPKWFSFRSFHPDANIHPNSPIRIRRGDTVTVDLRAQYQGQRWYTNTINRGTPFWHACGSVTDFDSAKADVLRAVGAEVVGNAEAAYRIAIITEGEDA